jgi:glycosyltransferase involved in cell wall biosynthesis
VSHNSSRITVYVTHQSLQGHPGGASAVTAWVLQALQRDFDVLLATPDEEVDFNYLDQAYGTSLATAQIGVHALPLPGWVRRIPESKLKSLRLAASFRNSELHRHGADLIFNTANEMSFLGPSINYVHCPIRHRGLVAELYQGRERWIRTMNNVAFKVIAHFNEQDFRRSVCIANSQWTADALLRLYGVKARVIYPPVTVPIRFPRPLHDRSYGYVCIGRISPEKRVHEAIEIIDSLHATDSAAHLHIVGTGGGPYFDRIQEEVRRRPYVKLHCGISRAELTSLLDEHRFGLHMMRNEHFGMAVAEMTAAGMLVIAHRSAGPMEILGPESPLLFAQTQQALQIAIRFHKSQMLQADIQAKIAERQIAESFSPEIFMSSVRQIAQETIN